MDTVLNDDVLLIDWVSVHILRLKVSCQTRQAERAKSKGLDDQALCATLLKEDMVRCGIQCSRAELQDNDKGVYFSTKSYLPQYPFYELQFMRHRQARDSSNKIRKGIHKINYQDGNTLRVYPYFGNIKWLKMENDPDVPAAFNLATFTLRIMFPKGLKVKGDHPTIQQALGRS